MREMDMWYEILGIEETASEAEVKKAYKQKAALYHPDKTGGDKAKEVLYIAVNDAYQVLGDSRKRALYNLKLRMHRASAKRPTAKPHVNPFNDQGSSQKSERSRTPGSKAKPPDFGAFLVGAAFIIGVGILLDSIND